MAQAQIDEAKLRAFFANPSAAQLHDDMTDQEFERFIEYVFRRAGYSVEFTAPLHQGDGLDLRLYVGPVGSGLLKAGVQVKQWDMSKRVPAKEVVTLKGGLPEIPAIEGFFVTTSDFTPDALTQARKPKRIWPIDGAHLVRYINYVRGSRLDSVATSEPGSSLAAYAAQPIAPSALFTADEIVRRPVETTKVLTLANHKGGVGKTTTALNFAFGLCGHEKKNRVLLVDMDPQANATRILTRSREEQGNGPPMTLVDYFSNRRGLAETVWKTPFERIWLIPSHNELTLGDTGLSAGPEAELRFVRDLHALTVKLPGEINSLPFDWIIIDTGPSMGFFTRTSIAASHYVVLPVSPGVFADIGVNQLRHTKEAMEALIGHPISLLGGIVTHWKEDAISTQLMDQFQRSMNVLGKPIPFDRTGIENAHIQTGQGKPKFLDRRTRASKAYAALLEEVLKRVNKQRHTVTASSATNGKANTQAAGD
jgi:chromosome partitioning protein